MRASIMMRLRGDERGVYAILFAIIIIVLFTMVAIAVDLSSARAEVRANQSRSDFAALAAVEHLPDDPVAACNAAWDYIRLNMPLLPSSAGSPCGSFIAACDASTPAKTYEATGEAPYVITFVYPVPDNHPLMTANGQGLGQIDGSNRCERFGVVIVSEQDVLFGGVVGSAGLNAPANAVAKRTVETGTETPIALLILDPTGCKALVTSGQGSVAVYGHDAATPGRITLDSDGLKNANPNVCGSNDYTLDNLSVNQGFIKACSNRFSPATPDQCDEGGIIKLFAMTPGQLTCLPGSINNACDPVDISPPARLYPVPLPLEERTTRRAADLEWNCKTNYPNYVPYPGGPSIPIADCTNSTPAYIDQLDTLGTTGNSVPSASWSTYSDCSPADGTVIAPGNYYVDCNDFRVGSGNTITFQGGNVVFRKDVSVQGRLNFNTANPAANLADSCRRPNDLLGACLLESSAQHAYMMLRNGGTLSKGAQGSLNINRTMVRLTTGGRINIGAGSPTVRWTAPKQRSLPTADDPSTPDVDEASPAGPFDKLALWSESTAVHTLGGQSPLDIEGVFFTPFADPFNLDGQAEQFLDRAQFLTFRMNVSGQGILRMQPDPEFVLSFPIFGVVLIR